MPGRISAQASGENRARQAAGPIALHEYVRLAQQAGEPLALLLGAQVERGRELAAARVDVERRKARQMRRRHAHDVGAVRGERAAANRAGDHARQVEHADAGQRPLACGQRGGPEPRRSWVISSSGSVRDRLSLRVRGPLGGRAHHGGDQLGVGGGRLECLALPLGSAACTASRS